MENKRPVSLFGKDSVVDLTAHNDVAPVTSAPPPFTLNPQQQAGVDFALGDSRSFNVIARAGTGKTSFLVKLLEYLEGDVTFMAYNKSAANEIQERVSKNQGRISCRVKCSTVHAAGFSAWKFTNRGKLLGRDAVNDYKVRNILDSLAEGNELYVKYGSVLRKWVSLAKQSGFGVQGMSPIEDESAWLDLVDYYSLDDDMPDDGEMSPEHLVPYAVGVYRRSLDQCREVVDFDDMLLAPLYYGARFFPCDWVLLDEAQDTNRVRREIAIRMLKPHTGRLIAVGDDRQAIYGFTGADSDAMDRIKGRLGSAVLPLTVTYRCPKAVVALAQQWVPDIQAHESAPEGIVRSVRLEPLAVGESSTVRCFWDDQPFTHTDAVLCRNTKPLVELAYAMLRKRIPCRIEGRDIGQSMITLCRKWKVTMLDGLTTRLTEYRRREVANLMAKKREQKAAEVEDKVDTLLVLIDAVRLDGKNRVQDLIDLINSMFGDLSIGEQPRCITLSTIHKAKGREWDRVFILGRNRYMPSKWAKRDWEKRQEENLMYVAMTRAKRELVDIIVPAVERRAKQ